MRDTPIKKMKDLMAHIQREPARTENRRKITLTRQQVLACVRFADMVNVAWEEELAGTPLGQRTAQQFLLLGQGGTGKMFIVLYLFIPLVNWAFPPDGDGDRYMVLAHSHAQADAISTRDTRA